MWFKQIRVFQIAQASVYSREQLQEKLLPLAFRPCPPSAHYSIGWVSPVEEDENLTRMIPGYTMLCLQIEQKILPMPVVRQALEERIKQIQLAQDRKVYQKEKLSLKDEIILSLLPRAFSKLTRVYCYIDTKNNWLVLGTDNAKKSEQFVSLFKKSVTENISSFNLKKISSVLTNWLINQNYPTSFSIEKSVVLQDARQKNRTIRCQQQDLFAPSIKALINDGCEVKQLALCWQDTLNFVLSNTFSLTSLKYSDKVIAAAKESEPETEQQLFDADFWIMTGILSAFLKELLGLFIASENVSSEEVAPINAIEV